MPFVGTEHTESWRLDWNQEGHRRGAKRNGKRERETRTRLGREVTTDPDQVTVLYPLLLHAIIQGKRKLKAY